MSTSYDQRREADVSQYYDLVWAIAYFPTGTFT